LIDFCFFSYLLIFKKGHSQIGICLETQIMRLMISIVSAAEGQEALQGRAEILDIKNPVEGSLGAQSPSTIREIVNLFSGRVQISAAIGDMPNLPGTAALAALGAATCGVDYVKVGLRGSSGDNDVLALLREVQQAVQGFSASVIAAAYADYRRANTLDPERLPRLAADAGVKGCLIDTAIKDGRSLFDFLAPPAIRALAEQAHEFGLLFALAGALHESDLPLARDLGVDIAGFRTAACQDNKRNGRLDADLVRRLSKAAHP